MGSMVGYLFFVLYRHNKAGGRNTSITIHNTTKIQSAYITWDNNTDRYITHTYIYKFTVLKRGNKTVERKENKTMQKLNIIYKDIKQLKPYKNNAKKHTKEQVERIANSIEQFGFTQPVVVDKNNCVVAGHGRVLGAKKAKLKQVPTVTLEDLTEEQIKAYRLIDNKLNESDWNEQLLEQELNELKLLTEDIDMELFGFTIDTLADETIEVEPEVQFTEVLHEENNYIVLKFDNKINWINAMGLLGIEKVKAYPTSQKAKKGFDRHGIGRVINGQEALERIMGND